MATGADETARTGRQKTESNRFAKSETHLIVLFSMVVSATTRGYLNNNNFDTFMPGGGAFPIIIIIISS